jgi:hypothetical protein
MSNPNKLAVLADFVTQVKAILGPQTRMALEPNVHTLGLRVVILWPSKDTAGAWNQGHLELTMGDIMLAPEEVFLARFGAELDAIRKFAGVGSVAPSAVH